MRRSRSATSEQADVEAPAPLPSRPPPAVLLRAPRRRERRAVQAAHDALLEVQYEAAFYDDLFSDADYIAICAFEPALASADSPPSALAGAAAALALDEGRRLIAGADDDAEDASVLVGVASARCYESSSALGALAALLCGARTGYIMTLGVLPRFRRRGVARLLLEQLCEQLRQRHGCAAVALHCLASNAPAQALYASLGFERLDLLRSHYFFGGRWHDAVYMRRSFRLRGAASHAVDVLVRGSASASNLAQRAFVCLFGGLHAWLAAVTDPPPRVVDLRDHKQPLDGAAAAAASSSRAGFALQRDEDDEDR